MAAASAEAAMPTPPKPTTEITKDEFRQWTQNCRPRKVQKPRQELMKEAESRGVDPEEVLKSKGFRDFAYFTRSCERFQLRCKEEELAELGTGFVLYFRLLRWLAILLFVIGLLEIPVMAIYGGADAMAWWNYYTGSMDNLDSCACLSEGPDAKPDEEQDYGSRCGTWDVDHCFAADSRYTNLGKWCCRSWCYANPRCPEMDNDTSPSLSTRQHFSGFVRRSVGCPQNETLLEQRCGSLPDTAFDGREGPDMTAISSKFVAIWYLSAGSLGPSRANQAVVLIMFTVIAVVLCATILVLRRDQQRTDEKVDEISVMPNDFAVMVSGLPREATSESDIADFFKKHAIKNQETEVVKVVIGWDAGAYRSKMKKLAAKRLRLRQVETGAPKTFLGIPCPCMQRTEVTDDPESLKKEIAEITAQLFQEAPDSGKLLSSGTVVVILRWQGDVRKCLGRWCGFWQWWRYSETGEGGFFPGQALPTFGTEEARLRVVRAANPGDINWDELGHSTRERNILLAKTSFGMLLLLFLGLLLTWAMNNLQNRLKEEREEMDDAEGIDAGSQALSLLVALVITVVNIALRMAGRIFGDWEYQDTFGQQEFSQATKMSISMILNTGLVVLLINWKPRTWYLSGGLVDDVFYMLIMDSIGARLCLIFDMTYTFNAVVRRQLTEGKVEEFNQIMKDNLKRETREQQEAMDYLISNVEGFKQAYEPEEIDNPDRYARILTTFLCSIFFAPIFPASVFIGVAGLLLQYMMDKVLLLWWYKRPRPQNAVQAKWSLKILRVLAPVLLSVGVVLFLSPSWKNRRQVLQFFIVSLVISVLSWLLPSWAVRTLSWKGTSDEAEEEQPWMDYYKAQKLWPKELKYHLDQPLYKHLWKRDRSKNPEMLSPGADRSTGNSDLQECFHTGDFFARRKGRADQAGLTGRLGRTSQGPQRRVSRGTRLPRWEYSAGDGFRPFAEDCRDELEAKYQEFQANPEQAQVRVNNDGTTVVVDFEKMTQQVEGRTKTRKVQRVCS